MTGQQLPCTTCSAAYLTRLDIDYVNFSSG